MFHLASVVGVSTAAADAGSTTDVILGGTRTALDAAARAGCRHFVFVSSSEVYGESNVFPITESTPHAPLSAYGKAKSAAEQLVREQAAAHGMRATIIRPFNVYGPQQRLDFVIPRFSCRWRSATKRSPSSGTVEQLRTFTYITDFVAGTLAAVAEVDGSSGIYNISGADTWSLMAVAAGVVRALDSGSQIVNVDPTEFGPAVAHRDQAPGRVAPARQSTPGIRAGSAPDGRHRQGGRGDARVGRSGRGELSCGAARGRSRRRGVRPRPPRDCDR